MEQHSKGFVAVFDEPFTPGLLDECVRSWIERFDKVEQVCPDQGPGAVSVTLTDTAQIMREDAPQFRILMGEQFAWAYITMGRHVIETTGIPTEGVSLCLEALVDLPGVMEIIDQHNDKRLDQLEADGIL